MAKGLNDILKGVNKSKIVPGSTGNDPGVDYAQKSKDGRDFVARHKVEKREDRVGNGEDVYNASKIKQAEDNKHGNIPDPKAKKTYKQYNEAKDPREYGYEGEMAISQIKSIMNHSSQLMKMLKPETDLPEWVQSKITLASDYIQTAADYYATEVTEDSKCNMTEAGTMCEVHGMKTCGEKEEKDSASDKEPRYNGNKKEGRQLITDRKLKEANDEENKGNFDNHFEKQPKKMQDAINLHLRKGKSYKEAIAAAKVHVKEEHIFEREMTTADKKKEEKLKSKYDDSGMKSSMKKQYGDEKGKQVYFAYIRKKAMKEAKNSEDDTIEFVSQPGKKYYRQQDDSYGEKETHSIKFPGNDKKYYADGPDPTKNMPVSAGSSSEKKYTTSVYPNDGASEYKNMKRDNSAQKISQKDFDKEFDSENNKSLRSRASGAKTSRIVNKARQSLKKEQADTAISMPSGNVGDTGRV